MEINSFIILIFLICQFFKIIFYTLTDIFSEVFFFLYFFTYITMYYLAVNIARFTKLKLVITRFTKLKLISKS